MSALALLAGVHEGLLSLLVCGYDCTEDQLENLPGLHNLLMEL